MLSRLPQRFYEEILPFMEAHDPDQLDTLITRQNLAYSYQQLGRHDEARKAYEELLPVLRDKLGDDHPVTLHATNNLADVRKRMEEHEDTPEPENE